MRARERVDQLRGDPNPWAGFAHGPFEYIPHPKLPPDLLNVNGRSLIRKTRIASDDEEPADAAKRGNDFLDHAVSEIFLLRVATHISKRQHRDRRLVGQRKAGTALRQHRATRRHYSVCTDGAHHILERLLAHI